jgi:hypothetical protein
VDNDPISQKEVRPAPIEAGASDDEVQLRRDLLDHIASASFPATRNDLLRHVGPDGRGLVESRLRMLPPDKQFDSPEQVLSAFGGMATGPSDQTLS